MTIFLPALSTKGWIKVIDDPLIVANQIFSHFFCSDFSQTQLFYRHVSSFSYILEKGNGNIDNTILYLKNDMFSYFSSYFDDVIVEVTESPIVFSGQATLSLYIKFSKNGIPYTLYKAIELIDGTVKKIINISNYGE